MVIGQFAFSHQGITGLARLAGHTLIDGDCILSELQLCPLVTEICINVCGPQHSWAQGIIAQVPIHSRLQHGGVYQSIRSLLAHNKTRVLLVRRMRCP